MIIKWHNAKWKSDKLYLFYEYNNKIHIYICVCVISGFEENVKEKQTV